MSVNNNKKIKGFDPENLTFDEVKIKEKDRINVTGWGDREVIGGNLGYLAVVMDVENYNRIKGTKVYMPIVALNITAHYPEKPKQYFNYFNKNGSVQLPLEANQDYWFIYGRGVGNTYWSSDEEDLYMLRTENIFLDKETAKKALDQKEKGLEVLEKLKEINRENDWVENFDGSHKNYSVVKTDKDRTIYAGDSMDIAFQGTFHFCKEASYYFSDLDRESREAFFNLRF